MRVCNLWGCAICEGVRGCLIPGPGYIGGAESEGSLQSIRDRSGDDGQSDWSDCPAGGEGRAEEVHTRGSGSGGGVTTPSGCD